MATVERLTLQVERPSHHEEIEDRMSAHRVVRMQLAAELPVVVEVYPLAADGASAPCWVARASCGAFALSVRAVSQARALSDLRRVLRRWFAHWPSSSAPQQPSEVSPS